MKSFLEFMGLKKEAVPTSAESTHIIEDSGEIGCDFCGGSYVFGLYNSCPHCGGPVRPARINTGKKSSLINS